MTMPAAAYFQGATSSFLASATIVVFCAVAAGPVRGTTLAERRARLVPQPQPRQLDQHGLRNLGLPAFDTPCSWSTERLAKAWVPLA